ncbi:MAG: NAD-dependent epimerase/dehydratase family protein [Verrucomicrobia bacterium]|nr:NAD-dependent epimerase/dehydratase family protein [Verrucomicrobiota bacterium]
METVAQLEERLSEPTAGVVETLRHVPGDILVLGVAGKMGPTLARLARRAADAAGSPRRVIGVSRFSAPGQMEELTAHGVEAVRCDLLDEEAVAKLPDAPNVIYMAGMKFGATGNESLTWAMNSYLPAIVCRRYRRSRIVAFSTGNHYGLVPVTSGGSREVDLPNPVGEYAMSCLGRERIFEHFSRTLNIPVALIRLNYACELRYGVLVDIAQQVWSNKPVDTTMGYLNTIWQGDANAMALQAFARTATPPFVVNVTGPERLSVRGVAGQFGRILDKRLKFTGAEAQTALLSNASRAFQMFGPPRVNASQLIEMVADWVQRGGATLNKPTHFETRDGKF